VRLKSDKTVSYERMCGGREFQLLGEDTQ